MNCKDMRDGRRSLRDISITHGHQIENIVAVTLAQLWLIAVTAVHPTRAALTCANTSCVDLGESGRKETVNDPLSLWCEIFLIRIGTNSKPRRSSAV